MKNTIYKKKTATLAEVALKASVSRQTAGRILGEGAHKHKPATVEKVQHAADALGYRPNLLAKSVVSGHTHSIGVLVPRTNSDDFFFNIITGIQTELNGTPFVPIILNTSEEESEKRQIHRLVDRRVDGVLLIPSQNQVDSEHFKEIIDRQIPLACLNVQLNHATALHFVGTAEYRGGQLAAEHILSNGQKNIGIIKSKEPSQNMDQRCAGFQETIARAGATCTTLELPSWELEENLDLLCDGLNQPDRPTAFFCATDLYAAMLYKAAEKLELRIPRDFSVIGFADLMLARYLSPSLTTIRQDGEKLGRTAARLLIDQIEGKKQPTAEIIIEPQLIERDSVASL